MRHPVLPAFATTALAGCVLALLTGCAGSSSATGAGGAASIGSAASSATIVRGSGAVVGSRTPVGSGTAMGSGAVATVTPRPSNATCVPPAGGRCGGPRGIETPLTASSDGRTVVGRFTCGGVLTAAETARTVTLTYTAAPVRAGGLQCALVPLSVHLVTPLSGRRVVDGVTGDHLTVRA